MVHWRAAKSTIDPEILTGNPAFLKKLTELVKLHSGQDDLPLVLIVANSIGQMSLVSNIHDQDVVKKFLAMALTGEPKETIDPASLQ